MSTLTASHIHALKFKTPYFLFSKSSAKANYQDYAKAFGQGSVHYSMKSNGHRAVVEPLTACGAHFEISSRYELGLLKKLNVSPDRIIFGSSVAPAADIRSASKYGVRYFACDSKEQLALIGKIAGGAKVYFRLKADDSNSVFKMSGKFGVSMQGLYDLLDYALQLNVGVAGISFNIGSESLDATAWSRGIEQLRDLYDKQAQKGAPFELINIGGGFPHGYVEPSTVPDIATIAESVHASLSKFAHTPRLVLEPGRGISATTAVMVSRVYSRIDRGGKDWLFLDAGGYNGLLETMQMQGGIRYRSTLLRDSDAPNAEFVLTGPTCDSLDTFDMSALLPSDISVGDRVVIHDVGAYSNVFSIPFNGFPRPQVHCID